MCGKTDLHGKKFEYVLFILYFEDWFSNEQSFIIVDFSLGAHKKVQSGLKLDTILRKQHTKNLENWNFKPGKSEKTLESAMKMWVATLSLRKSIVILIHQNIDMVE